MYSRKFILNCLRQWNLLHVTFLSTLVFFDCLPVIITHKLLYAIITVKSIGTSFHKMSGDGEIRTLDPLLARQVLSQLSYTPIGSGLKWTRTIDLTLIRRAL